MVNVVVMGLEAQYKGTVLGQTHGYLNYRNSDETWPSGDKAFYWLNLIFGVIFFIELTLKIMAMRHTFFQFGWNWLDFIIVAIWLVEKLGLSFGVDPLFVRLLRLGK